MIHAAWCAKYAYGACNCILKGTNMSDLFDQADVCLQEPGDEQQRAEAEQEQYLIYTEAIREALTMGVSLENVQWLCMGCGVEYRDVVGEV